MIISKTPYRVSLFGGGTDFPEWYLKNGGACISFTLDKYSWVSTKKLPPFFDHKYRISMSSIDNAKELSSIRFTPVREAIRLYAAEFGGIEIHHQGDLPARSGLGSSSSFVVGLINSLRRLTGVVPSQFQLAKDAIFFEQEVLKEIVGSQDQIACAFGGLNLITFRKNGSWDCSKIKVVAKNLNFLSEHMILVYSGVERVSSDISRPLVGHLLQKSSILNRTRSLVDDCLSILHGDASDYFHLGELLDESWHLKKQLNPLSVTPALDEIYSRAISQGALGGKVLGAGGGGFLLLITRPEDRERLIQGLSGYIHVPFRISEGGSQVISDWEDITLK
jgi:D-glycero-alpha-D-manno-heptose-7-phosphate kinase